MARPEALKTTEEQTGFPHNCRFSAYRQMKDVICKAGISGIADRVQGKWQTHAFWVVHFPLPLERPPWPFEVAS